MKYRINYVVLMLCLFSWVFQSCSEDESFEEEISNFQNGNNQNHPGNGNHGSGNGDRDAQVHKLNAEVLEEWMDLFLEIDRYADGMRPNSTARSLAYINISAYETAVKGMREFKSLTRILDDFDLPSQGQQKIDYLLALNESYALTFDHFIVNIPNSEREKIELLRSALEEDYSEGLSNKLIEASQEFGQKIALGVIEYAQTDLEAEEQILEPQPLSYEPPVGDGYWTYSADEERALFPYWESVRTFVVAPEQTTSVDPIAYSENSSSPYFIQMQEVYKENDVAREEDGEALWIAEFWSDDVTGLVFSPPARQFSISNQLIDQRELNLEEALHLNLKLGLALNDAAVSAWKYKYQYMVMRPNVFIHEFIDPEFQTNLFRLIPWPNPTFPGYPSGHSCFASSAGGVFIEFFGPQANFTDKSHEGRIEFRGAPRSFQNFTDLIEENAFSRVPLGVHMRMDCTEGMRLGYEISDAVNEFSMKKEET